MYCQWIYFLAQKPLTSVLYDFLYLLLINFCKTDTFTTSSLTSSALSSPVQDTTGCIFSVLKRRQCVRTQFLFPESLDQPWSPCNLKLLPGRKNSVVNWPTICPIPASILLQCWKKRAEVQSPVMVQIAGSSPMPREFSAGHLLLDHQRYKEDVNWWENLAI